MLVFFLYDPLKGWICGKILCEFGFFMEYLVYPSMVIESFSGYSNLGWHLCSLRVCITSVQDLLAFIASGEMSGVIIIGLPLYVFVCLFVCLFGDRVSLYRPGCPGTHFVDQAGLKLRNEPASASQGLGLKACATTPGMVLS